MKLDQRHNNLVSSGGIGEDSSFSIAMNAKMFRTLSDTMYQDKIGSMIRELSCNAMDAHIASGDAGKPFFIHLPDQIEPWFSVKDEGIGLSDEDVRAMYTTYGESTKDQSNEMVGAFGLGSKTPFAYTDQFTVTSIFDSVKRVYIAVMDDNGLPKLVLQHESNTTEHNGLEVSVSVNDYDFETFRDKVVKQLQFFKVKPALVNNRHGVEFAKIDEYETLIEKDNVRVFNGARFNRNIKSIDGLWIVQGGIGYELSIDKLGDIDVSTRAFSNAIREKGAIIDFNIGDVEVTASREGISYTVNTCKTIVAKLTEVARSLAAESVAEMCQMKSIWERAVKFNGLLDFLKKAVQSSSGFDSLFPSEKVSLLRNSMVMKVDSIEDIGLNAVIYQKHSAHKRGTYTRYEKMIRRSISNDTKYSYHSSTEVHLYPDIEMEIFVRDTNIKPIARLNHYSESNDYKTIMLIEGFKDEVEDKDIKKVAKLLDMPVNAIKRLSTLVAPKSVSNGNGGAARPRAYSYQKNNSTYSSKEWDGIYDSIDDIPKSLWVRMDRHDISWKGNNKVVLEAVKHGVIDMPLIAVNGQTADRIEAGKIGEQLVSLESVAQKLLDRIEELKPVHRAIGKYGAFLSGIASGNKHVHKVVNENIKGLNNVRVRVEQLKERVKGYEWAFDNDEIFEKAQTAGNDAGYLRNKAFIETYPMLQHLSMYSTIPEQDIMDYINIVDMKNSL